MESLKTTLIYMSLPLSTITQTLKPSNLVVGFVIETLQRELI